VIESSDNLTQWSQAGTITLGDSGTGTFTDSTGSAPKRFYRARTTSVAPPPPFKVGLGTVGNGAAAITVAGSPHSQYVIESSDNLTQWSPAGSITLGDSGTGTFTDSSATVSKRFYRARLGP